MTRLDFWKSHCKGPKCIIQKSSFARKSQMWWYRRGNSGGSWLLEEKKLICARKGKENSGGSWPPAFPRSPYKKCSSVKLLPDIVVKLSIPSWTDNVYLYTLGEIKISDFNYFYCTIRHTRSSPCLVLLTS